MGKVISVNISEQKGVPKHPIEKGYFEANHGLAGDAHAGSWHRQVSFLGAESIEKVQTSGLKGLYMGKFAENITTEGITLYKLPVGTRLRVGETLMEVTQIGKECHEGCAIRKLVGDCVMPREGIFARVLTSGWVKPGDMIEVLPEISDILCPKEVLPVLKTKYMGRSIIHCDSVGSTNELAREKAAEGCSEGLAVIAEEQTAGKGRLGRKWVTPKSAAIAMSLVLRPQINPEDAPGITLTMGLAVCRAIKSLLNIDAEIKWPNDIVIGGKKVCGILTEMSADVDRINYVIVGVGINVNVYEFPDDIRKIATSLCIEAGATVSRKDVLSAILLEFERLYDIFNKTRLNEIIDSYKKYSATLGKTVRVNSVAESFEGQAIDITQDGVLLVRCANGEIKRVLSGDVSVRGLNGYI